MDTQRVQITYSSVGFSTSGELWSKIKSSFLTQFPLRTLYWKSGTRTSIRTIQELKGDLISFESAKEESVSQIPLSLLDKPFLNILFVACDVRAFTMYYLQCH